MKLPHSVCEVLRDHVVLESECIDRMYLNVYVPQLQRIGGVVWYAFPWVDACAVEAARSHQNSGHQRNLVGKWPLWG